MEQFTKTTGDPAPPTGSGTSPVEVDAAASVATDAPTAGAEPAALPDPDAAPPARSTASLAVLTAAAAVLLGAVVWHLGMVFLTLAPANSVTNRYQHTINGYIYPEFGQNWQMFAPNPLAQNVAVGARVETLGQDGTRRTSDWVNLSAVHVRAMHHNPVPSHVDQNVLRRSWNFYTDTHDLKDKPTNGMRSELSTEYLARIALQRFKPQWSGDRILRIQLASRTTVVAPPKWTGQKAPDTTAYRILPWWPVKEKFYKEL